MVTLPLFCIVRQFVSSQEGFLEEAYPIRTSVTLYNERKWAVCERGFLSFGRLQDSPKAIDLKQVQHVSCSMTDAEFTLHHKDSSSVTFRAPTHSEKRAWVNLCTVDPPVDGSAVPMPPLLRHVILSCVEFLDRKDHAGTEGVFRLSASTGPTRALLSSFLVDGAERVPDGTDVHVVANVLKTCLRRLPETVLTAAAIGPFIAAASTPAASSAPYPAFVSRRTPF